MLLVNSFVRFFLLKCGNVNGGLKIDAENHNNNNNNEKNPKYLQQHQKRASCLRPLYTHPIHVYDKGKTQINAL